FPPKPPSASVLHKIITNYCDAIDKENLLEEGCAVCGTLTTSKTMIPLDEA
ncbi:hypothetical protein FA95DRAFT_1472512, partial [Auriscalpium vulgare]